MLKFQLKIISVYSVESCGTISFTQHCVLLLLHLFCIFPFVQKKKDFQHALPQKFQRGWPNGNKMFRGHDRKKGRETQKEDLFVTTLTNSQEVKQGSSA